MQAALEEVDAWAHKHGLIFNPAKTQVMLCNRGRKYSPKEPELWLGGQKLSYSDNIKYLGVQINKRLIWSHHVKDRYKKCTHPAIQVAAHLMSVGIGTLGK